ncbi:hypothetical protein ABZ897_38220 [Nonomuraea sp. NPDC046802]
MIPAQTTQRGFIYFPALAEGTKSMTFEIKDTNPEQTKATA